MCRPFQPILAHFHSSTGMGQVESPPIRVLECIRDFFSEKNTPFVERVSNYIDTFENRMWERATHSRNGFVLRTHSRNGSVAIHVGNQFVDLVVRTVSGSMFGLFLPQYAFALKSSVDCL